MTPASAPRTTTERAPLTRAQVWRDVAAIAAAISLVAMVAALFAGDVAQIVLPLAAVAAAASVPASWARRVAIGAAVVLLGGWTGLVAHWSVYDHSALAEHWTVNGLVVRGLVALTFAASGVALAHRPQTRTRPKSS